MTPPIVLSATADPVELADHLELRAISAADRSSSLEDLIADIRRTGTSEEYGCSEEDDECGPGDRGSEKSEACALDAFAELEDRQSACGGISGYPFQVHDRSIRLKENGEDAVYTFLLLLSRYGFSSGPTGSHPERLFEDICRIAAENYFGGPALGGKAVHFGFPRRVLPRNFTQALRALMTDLNDGLPKEDAPRSRAQKDAKLDIVAWKDFPDGRRGKLIGYGQCAVGQTDWKEKLSELQPGSFNKKWLRELPTVDPTRLFFAPFRIDLGDWDDTCFDAGILFDRCRITAVTGTIPEALHANCISWSHHVIAKELP